MNECRKQVIIAVLLTAVITAAGMNYLQTGSVLQGSALLGQSPFASLPDTEVNRLLSANRSIYDRLAVFNHPMTGYYKKQVGVLEQESARRKKLQSTQNDTATFNPAGMDDRGAAFRSGAQSDAIFAPAVPGGASSNVAPGSGAVAYWSDAVCNRDIAQNTLSSSYQAQYMVGGRFAAEFAAKPTLATNSNNFIKSCAILKNRQANYLLEPVRAGLNIQHLRTTINQSSSYDVTITPQGSAWAVKVTPKPGITQFPRAEVLSNFTVNGQNKWLRVDVIHNENAQAVGLN